MSTRRRARTRMWAWGVAVIIGLIALSGCSGNAPQDSTVQVDQATTSASPFTAPTQPDASETSGGGLRVTKVGYGVDTSAVGTYVTAVAVIHNGTADIASLQVVFAAYDAKGEVLAQQDTSAPIARSGATVATTVPIEIKQGNVAKVTAEVNVLQKQKDGHPESAFVASGVRYRPGAYDASVTGQITSRYDDNVKDAYVTAVCLDRTGRIVGGGEDYFTVRSGGSTAVDVHVTGKNIRSCQLYPTLGGASSTG